MIGSMTGLQPQNTMSASDASCEILCFRFTRALAKREDSRISKRTRMTNSPYFAEVLHFLRLESEAIAQTAARLDQVQVERVIDLLAGCKGKVVISGVGKSAIIAQKIAATMTSAGTAALYLHPSDA